MNEWLSKIPSQIRDKNESHNINSLVRFLLARLRLVNYWFNEN